MTQPSRILVTGDVVLDQHVYRGRRTTLASRSSHGVHQVREWGGAAATYRLISAVLAIDRGTQDGRAECRLAVAMPDSDDSDWPESLTSTLVWSPHPASEKDSPPVWRIDDAFGYGPAAPEPERRLKPASDLPFQSDILVLDDAGDGFRHVDHEDVWGLGSSAEAAVGPSWIVLKLGGPIGQGDLWRRLLTHDPGGRLVILVSAAVLRDAGIRLSRGLSWERATEHLLQALAGDPTARHLTSARHVVVNFEGDGAVWIIFADPKAPIANLVFDAANAEGEWGAELRGDSTGYQSCMTAAVTLALANHDTARGEPDLRDALVGALSAMRQLRAGGHGPAETWDGRQSRGVGFPVERLAGIIVRPVYAFALASAPWPRDADPLWTILGDLHGREPGGNLSGFARQIARHGEAMLETIPHLRLGRLLTVSRTEMEALRGLRRIMEAYRSGNDTKPLSIGVFGAPGAGKSFGVRELSTGVFARKGARDYEGWMEFNLSQFDGPADLIGAFHQVRDRVLQGLVPVVFWDEFDSQDLKWLRYLLAPMQDGRFQEGQVTHGLGRCVFIFAGGTATRFADFGPGPDAGELASGRFRAAKGPDFKSRLDDHLDVLGLNPQGPDDNVFPVRRALMLRSMLRLGARDPLDIDFGLLTALVDTRAYHHGARSMEKLLQPLRTARAAGEASVRRWRLPAPGQMQDHVDADDFHRLCGAASPFQAPDVADRLAPAIHKSWRGLVGHQATAPRWDIPFEDLPDTIKNANRAAARRMPENLALVGLRLEPGRATEPEEGKVGAILERHMETLAQAEHLGWMAHMLAEGWTFGEPRDDDARRHDCLRPYQELSAREKEKDRGNIRRYPELARLAGFRIAET